MEVSTSSWSDPAVVEAVRAVLAGKNDAFVVIVRHYQGAIRTLATVILRDPQAALEVTEDVLVRAWRGLKSYDPTRPLKAWLMGITHRVASDYQHQRAGRIRKERSYAAQTDLRPAQERPSMCSWRMSEAACCGKWLTRFLQGSASPSSSFTARVCPSSRWPTPSAYPLEP
jgi:RNA polymerase sigma factor (sigma-70 family)